MQIRICDITVKQKLTIRNSINTYIYIQNNWEDNSEDFKDVFTDFYLSAIGVMRRDENRIPYFNKMQSCDKNIDIVQLVSELHEELEIDKYLFSFATKLLHTINNNYPIFDSKIENYLKKEEKVDLWWTKKNTSVDAITRIKNDWPKLVKWYDDFLNNDNRSKEWINWFDNEYPDAKHISNIKKIDLIIFACN